jgi:hypothetical protein
VQNMLNEINNNNISSTTRNLLRSQMSENILQKKENHYHKGNKINLLL